MKVYTSFQLVISHSQDCRTQDQECTCQELTSDCRCGLNGRCLPDGSCHAAECAKLGLKECQCTKKSSESGLLRGSMLDDLNVCGVCCVMHDKCVAADEAARERLATSLQLPEGWPDEDYRGPNISVHLCEGFACNKTVVRAWPPGSVCVTQNVVGICAPRGLCKLDYMNPRSNVYPDIMNVRMMGQKRNSCRSLKVASITFIPTLLLFCLIK